MKRLLGRCLFWKRRRDDEEGQAMVEYATVTMALFGGIVMGWPFLVQLMHAMNVYYQSIYYVIQSPLP